MANRDRIDRYQGKAWPNTKRKRKLAHNNAGHERKKAQTVIATTIRTQETPMKAASDAAFAADVAAGRADHRNADGSWYRFQTPVKA